MAEFGEMDPKEWPDESKPLSANARIALKRIRQAIKEEKTTANSEYVEPRARADESNGSISISVIQQIASAIVALRSAGIEIKRRELPGIPEQTGNTENPGE